MKKMESNQKIDIACIAHIATEKCNCSKCKQLREVRQKCEAGTASPDTVLCLAEIDRLNLVWQKITQEVGNAAVRKIDFLETDINRLTNERDDWKRRGKAFERKLNAAILDMELIAEGNLCFYCKHGPASCEKSYSLHACGSFEWRGLQEEEEKTT